MELARHSDLLLNMKTCKRGCVAIGGNRPQAAFGWRLTN
jgi:hypothetical protein